MPTARPPHGGTNGYCVISAAAGQHPRRRGKNLNPPTRKQLRTLIGGGLWPQTVLRLGYGPPVSATPRRALADVVVDGPHSAVRVGRDQ